MIKSFQHSGLEEFSSLALKQAFNLLMQRNSVCSSWRSTMRPALMTWVQ